MNETNFFQRYSDVKSELIIDSNDNSAPEVSIVIPTYKRPHFLKEAITSAASQKSDTTFEIVIVDNDADGEFSAEIESYINSRPDYNIRYFRNEQNIGMFGNWNRCIELARGKSISILNDDDLLHPEWLQTVINLGDYSMVKVHCRTFEQYSDIADDFYPVKPATVKRISLSSLYFSNINPGSLGLLMDREKCLALGGFDEELYPASDYDFLCRFVAKHHDSVRTKVALAYYRWAENESIKPETRAKFVVTDFGLRKAHFPGKNALSKLAMSYLNQVVSVRYADTLLKENKDQAIGRLYPDNDIPSLVKIGFKLSRIKPIWSASKFLVKLML